MLNKAKTLQDKLTEIRRTIHQHPELGFEEFQTSKLVSDTLSDLGIDPQTGIGRTGVVARLGDGHGPLIGIRADMDALPILEANDVPYKSQVPGKMHACGHDTHIAMLMGVAKLLTGMKSGLKGTIVFLFQPAEEGAPEGEEGGAALMIKEGVLDNPRWMRHLVCILVLKHQ